MSGSFEVLSHTADTGIAVEAATLPELLAWAARGMFSLMYDLEATSPEATVEVAVASAGLDELLVDLLAELLYRSEADDVIPCRFDVVTASPTEVRMSVGVAPMEPAALHGPPIKAVTYHDLAVEQSADGRWSARVVFDV